MGEGFSANPNADQNHAIVTAEETLPQGFPSIHCAILIAITLVLRRLIEEHLVEQICINMV